MKKDRIRNRLNRDYISMADKCDLEAFKDGRDICEHDVYDYVTANMEWLDESDYCEEIDRLQSMGYSIVDSFIQAAMNFSKYPAITLAELDTYIESEEE